MSERMKVVTFKVTEDLLEQMDELVRRKIYATRSDLIRNAIIRLLQRLEEEGII